MDCLAGALACGGRKACPQKLSLYPVREPQIEELLAGEHIKSEFFDTRMNSETFGLDSVVKEATKKAREVIEKHPVFVFGNTGVGKSSLTNTLLQVLGDSTTPAPTDNMKPCTRGVDMYGCQTQTRAGPGQILLFDTEGWELDNAAPILRMCMKQAQKQGIPLEVLHNRLVLMLVVSGNPESQRHLDSPKFRSLVRQICNEFHRLKLKDRVKPVFVPVVSQIDKVTPEDRILVRRNVSSKLQEAVTDVVMFQEPILVSSKTHENMEQLSGRLRDIFNTQLQSSHILMLVRQLMHNDLKEFLKTWSRRYDGLEADSALVRRHVWSVARSYGLRVSNLDAAFPACRWRDLDVSCALLRKCRGQLLAAAAESGGCLRGCNKFSGFIVNGTDMPIDDANALHMDSLRRHTLRVGEMGVAPAQILKSRSLRSSVNGMSRSPEASEIGPKAPPTSIDLTHLRDDASDGNRPADGNAPALQYSISPRAAGGKDGSVSTVGSESSYGRNASTTSLQDERPVGGGTMPSAAAA